MVLAVIGVLVGLLLPALSRARFSSKVTLCLNQYRQWGIAAGVYATDDGQGRLPSYPLPTAQLSFIGPWIVAVEMVTNLAPYGVTVPMWFCPTRARFQIHNDNFRSLRGRDLLTPADLVDEQVSIQKATYYAADLMWWVPRPLGEKARAGTGHLSRSIFRSSALGVLPFSVLNSSPFRFPCPLLLRRSINHNQSGQSAC